MLHYIKIPTWVIHKLGCFRDSCFVLLVLISHRNVHDNISHYMSYKEIAEKASMSIERAKKCLYYLLEHNLILEIKATDKRAYCIHRYRLVCLEIKEPNVQSVEQVLKEGTYEITNEREENKRMSEVLFLK